MRLGVVRLIEPLGFANASLRFKEDVAHALDRLGGPACFALIHDTFHHAVSGEAAVFAELTQVVHVSGVTRDALLDRLRDADRGLGAMAQMARLKAAGYRGPFSIEAFAPDVHALEHPKAALLATIAFMSDQGASKAA